MHQSFETPTHVTLVVDNEIGAVTVEATGSDRTDILLDAASQGAEELIDRATVDCAPAGEGYLVRVLVPHQRVFGFHRHRVNVRVVVPAGADVDVSGASARYELRGAIEAATLRTASGTMDVGDVAGDLRASSASGQLTAGAVGGQLRFKSASGHVRASSARRLDIQMVSGTTTIDALHGDGSVSTVSGRTTIGSCTGGHLGVRSVSGAITLGIPRGVALRVDADSTSGRVRSEIALDDTPQRGGPGPDVVLSLRSVSGSITIERAVEQRPEAEAATA